MTLKWNGDKILKKVARAQIDAINTTMLAATIHAKNNHPWANQTGSLEGSIQINQPAHRVIGGARGVWGSEDIVYALRLELGFQGRDSKGVVINQAPMPYLRPAAAVQYPLLAGRIRVAL